MELVTASEVSKHTGLSPATVALYAKNGTFPTREDSNGRRRFVIAEVQEVIDQKGIKPRPRKSIQAGSEEPEPIETATEEESVGSVGDEVPSSDALPAQAVSIIAEALRRSKAAFRKSVQSQLADKSNDDEDPLEQDSELVCLRVYMRAPEIFDAVREELSK